MKKTIRIILCTAFFAVLAVSCQKEIEEVEPVAGIRETIEISINGLMGEYTQVDGTKAELVNNVRVSWKGGETVYVFDGAQCLGSLVASLDGTEDRYALLSTAEGYSVNKPADGTTKLTLVYSPLFEDAPAVSVGAISISLANQNSAKAPFVAYATLDYNNEETITNAIASFKFATSVIKVNCTGLKANTAIDQATLDNVNTACKLTLSATAAPTVAGDVNGIITKTGDEYFAASKVNAEGEAVFQIAVPALETASEARILTIAQESDTFIDKNFSKNSLGAATSVNTVCQLVKKQTLPSGALPGVFSVSATKKVHFSQGNLTYDVNAATNKWKFYEHQYDCADIGSASNTLISLFTWGYGDWSTNPATSAHLDDHTSDGKSFDPSKDWGSAIDDKGTWRTLTKDEWRYLFAYDSDTGGARYGLYKCGVTVCGKANCLVLAPDGFDGTIEASYDSDTWKTAEDAGLVCLPAAHSRYKQEVSDGGEIGGFGPYWSSSDYGILTAYYISFNGYDVTTGREGYRYCGYSVRLVTDCE